MKRHNRLQAWYHTIVIYEHSTYGLGLKRAFAHELFYYNGKNGTQHPICVEDYVDVDVDDFNSLDDRFLLRPNLPPIVLILAADSTTKLIFRHFYRSNWYRTKTPFQFILPHFNHNLSDIDDEQLPLYNKGDERLYFAPLLAP